MRNKKLFYEVADHIERYPDTYDQEAWAEPVVEVGNHSQVGEYIEYVEDFVDRTDVHVLHTCNTKACVAGWACILSSKSKDRYVEVVMDSYVEINFGNPAAELLGLSNWEAGVVFHERWMLGSSVDQVAERLREIGDGAPIFATEVHGVHDVYSAQDNDLGELF